MDHTDLELQRIAKARQRPVELSEAQFEYEKKIKRFKPQGFTYQKYNPGNLPESEQCQVLLEKNVRDLPVIPAAAGEQLDLFAVENTYVRKG